MAGKGRGIIVTQAVKSGALLAVGKPLGINKVNFSECCLLHSCCVTMILYDSYIVNALLLQHIKRLLRSALCLVDSCGYALHFLLMQQAILALHWLLQDIYGLIDNVTQACSDSKQTLQCIYSLCDGTEQSVANLPDIQIFAKNGTGIVNASLVYQHVQLHLLASHSVLKRPLAPAG